MIYTKKINGKDYVEIETIKTIKETNNGYYTTNEKVLISLEDIKQLLELTKKPEKTYYVYLYSPAGTELIGSGTREECEKIKAEKDADWKPGYYWHTEITEEKQEEESIWD